MVKKKKAEKEEAHKGLVETPSEAIIPYENNVVKSRKLGRVKGYLERNQRIAYNVFLKVAYQDLLQNPEKDTFEIGIKDFMKLCGFNYESYHSLLFTDTEKQKSLKTLLKELQTKTYELEWRDEKGEPYRVLSASLLAQFEMRKEDKKIIFIFPPFIRDAILTHQNFYILYLPVITKMRSTYSIALYEQILQRKNFGQWVVDIKDFRGLMGVEEGEYYKEFKNLRRYVVEKAINEINKILDIDLKYEKIQDEHDKKRVAALKFTWDVRKFKDIKKLEAEILEISDKQKKIVEIYKKLEEKVDKELKNMSEEEKKKIKAMAEKIAIRRAERYAGGDEKAKLGLLKNQGKVFKKEALMKILFSDTEEYKFLVKEGYLGGEEEEEKDKEEIKRELIIENKEEARFNQEINEGEIDEFIRDPFVFFEKYGIDQERLLQYKNKIENYRLLIVKKKSETPPSGLKSLLKSLFSQLKKQGKQ